MTIQNWLNKFGSPKSFLVGAGQRALSKLASVGDLLVTGSRFVGKIESLLDRGLTLASHIPVAKEVADTIRENSIYKGVRGSIDDIRSVVESPGFEKTLQVMHKLDKAGKHDVMSYFPSLVTPALDVATQISDKVRERGRVSTGPIIRPSNVGMA